MRSRRITRVDHDGFGGTVLDPSAVDRDRAHAKEKVCRIPETQGATAYDRVFENAATHNGNIARVDGRFMNSNAARISLPNVRSTNAQTRADACADVPEF